MGSIQAVANSFFPQSLVWPIINYSQDWPENCGMVIEILKLNREFFIAYICNNVSVAQLSYYLAGVLKDPGLIPGDEEFFSLKFLLKRI